MKVVNADAKAFRPDAEAVEGREMTFVQTWQEAKVYNSKSKAYYAARKANLTLEKCARIVPSDVVGLLGPGLYVAYIPGKGWIGK